MHVSIMESHIIKDSRSHLLLPAFEFLHQVIVSLRDLGQFGVHATLEVNEILPSFQSIA